MGDNMENVAYVGCNFSILVELIVQHIVGMKLRRGEWICVDESVFIGGGGW